MGEVEDKTTKTDNWATTEAPASKAQAKE